MERVCILLTTTVNVQSKVAVHQTSVQDRLFYYTRSLRQWLKKTPFKIVVVENTGYSYTEYKEEFADYIREKRLEIITFKESVEPMSRYLAGNISKGASEIFAIQYAFCKSSILHKSDFIIKITGRYYVPELLSLLEKKGDLTKYDGLRQNNGARCEMVGSNIRYFPMVFNGYLLDGNGNYDGHAENVYKYRISLLENVIECPVMHIEPTPMGGGPDIVWEL